MAGVLCRGFEVVRQSSSCCDKEAVCLWSGGKENSGSIAIEVQGESELGGLCVAVRRREGGRLIAAVSMSLLSVAISIFNLLRVLLLGSHSALSQPS